MATAVSVKKTCYYNGRLFKSGDSCNFSIKEDDPSAKYFNLKGVTATMESTKDETKDETKTAKK